MSATLNLHELLSTGKGYLQAIVVPAGDAVLLRQSREEIRETLRTAFANWDEHVRRAELLDGYMAKAASDFRLPAPKFRIQGSFAYHTVNDCQQTPPQQIDQDDGIFLPVGFITEKGTVRPIIASKAYFDIVERALEPLCRRKGWVLNPKRKDTCVRVELNQRLHIDLPLYAIADNAFETLVEANVQDLLKSADASRDIELLESVYRGLSENEIALAHRKEGWISSDPRKLEAWFETAVQTYGHQIRRICRAFKGMRDFRWRSCELGSICLMAAVVKAASDVDLDDRRDDLALMDIARELVRVLAQPVENPAFLGDPDKYLCKDWSGEFRLEIRQAFQEASETLRTAIEGTLNRDIAVQRARSVFGDRVPNDTSLVKLVGAAAAVRETPVQLQPRVVTPRTKSGER